MKTKLSILLFVLNTYNIYSKDTLQIVKGRVVNAVNSRPVQRAHVSLQGASTFHFYSDSLGYYEGKITPGNYAMLIQQQGFKSVLRNNIIVFSGKQQIQDFELTEFRVELDSLQIAPGGMKENINLDMWGFQRFAAVFYDPARVANSHAGLINTDDQANNISIHGTSPNFIQWKVEGVEVVNPNHLENAGTINDRPSLSGGGVSLFSAQLLQNSSFLLSPFEPSNGNALAGIFDMKLRNGNNQKYEHTLQASLMGLDFSMEGPFSKSSQASFLVNYRYSTIGLLNKLGVDFGGEETNYQDLSFVISIPQKHGLLKFFSITGTSATTFRGTDDSLKFEIQKDLTNLDYRSTTTINGINYLRTLNNNLFIRSIASYSAKEVSRYSAPTGFSSLMIPVEKDVFNQAKFSGVTYLSGRAGNLFRVKAGSYYSYFANKLFASVNDITYSNGSINDVLLQPFISVEGTVFKAIEIKAGLHSLYQVYTNDFTLQPRLMAKYTISKKQDIALNYGRSSQVQPFYLCLGNPDNRYLKPSITNSFALIHHINALQLDFKSELYLNFYERIPINSIYGFSAFNYFNERVLFPLIQNGTAKVYGYDLTVEKNLNSYYMILSGGIFNSLYTIGNVSAKSRYDSNYNCALTAGKEYRLKNKNKMISTDLRGFVRNGFKEAAPDPTMEYYVYQTNLPTYYRVDVRISYRINKEKTSAIWALDIQNVANNRNVVYHYYDAFTQKIESKRQLGLIPVISYKIYF
ncbi:MAG: carboxypeptidase-like regulatory domain-containing protein [Bacteroidota bacterium]